MIRTDWTRHEVTEIYQRPLIELMHLAAQTHRDNNNPAHVQVSTLLSIKTGNCSEDCAYCPQSARYTSSIEKHKLLQLEEVKESAAAAKKDGASRFCMGAAWRNVKDNSEFERVLEMVRTVKEMDMEVCCTLGMLSESQAQQLKDAGLHAYNHNLDTSREYYSEIITTRTYDERLETLKNARRAGLQVCCGGIIGLGEKETDRIELLFTLATLPEHPESVPINALVPVSGTPMENYTPPDSWEMIRVIACARVLMPKARIRLSAGRLTMNHEAQALCFMVGANSIFAGDKLLTTPNPEPQTDGALFKVLGIQFGAHELANTP